MSDFVFFNDRIFNKNAVTTAYVQFSAFTEMFVPVCEVTSSNKPVHLDAPTEDPEECKKIISDFFKALEGKKNED